MGVESAQPDRIGILVTRFALLVMVALLCAFSVALPAKPVFGQAIDVQAPPLKASTVDVTTNGASTNSTEAAEATEEVEPIESPENSEDQSLRNRLISYAFSGGLMLVFLGLLFGYLRLDHATRGFHSGRLQLAALVLVGIVLLVGYLLWTQVLFK